MKRRGFTLVELLIVVVILGILAAIVVPQFSDASTDARFSSLYTNLSTMRGQIELYRLQHNGSYPSLANFANQLTSKTDADGTINAAGKYGPYLQRVPNNPFTAPAGNDVSSGAASSTKAWYYDDTSGEFRANDGGTSNGLAHDSL